MYIYTGHVKENIDYKKGKKQYTVQCHVHSTLELS